MRVICWSVVPPLLLAFALAGPASAADAAVERIRMLAQELQRGGKPSVLGARLASQRLLPAFYAARGFAPAWVKRGQFAALRAAVRDSANDGLMPADYHLAALDRLAKNPPLDDAGQANMDVLLTDSLIRLAYHLSFGKADPEALDRDWNLARPAADLAPLEMLQGALAGDDLASAIAGLRPQHWAYDRLRSALVRYRGIAAAGGWQGVPPGPTLGLGDSGPRVRALRERLGVEGDATAYRGGLEAPFDADLEAAVKRFQQRHGIDVDGRVGNATRATLNVPVERRIDQIRVNLERARWVLHDLDDHFIVVNIAGFELFQIEGDGYTWRTDVQVGRTFRKTPVFKSKIRYMVVNPTWTVPNGILRKDILPAVKKNPGYLGAKNIRVLKGNGAEVSPSAIDWSQYESARGFPYRLVQSPGPKNALGRIKFMFPNEHAVYLHDTPSKQLFERTSRAFSSGCIRVKDPLTLATQLMKGHPKWSRRAAFEAAIDGGRTQTIRLAEPVTVMLMYYTVAVPTEGVVLFKQDIYARDARVLKALNGPFEFRKRAVFSAGSGEATAKRG